MIALPANCLAKFPPTFSTQSWYPQQFCRGCLFQIFGRFVSTPTEFDEKPGVYVQV